MATKAKQKSSKQKNIIGTIEKSLLSFAKGIDSKKIEKKVKKFSKEFAEQINKAIAKSQKKSSKTVAKKSKVKKVAEKAILAKAKQKLK